VDAEAYAAAKEAARNAKELAANKERLAGSSYANPSEELLTNGSFNTANQGWTLTNMGYQQNQERPTRYVEKWQGSALTGNGSATQTIKNMPAGAYVFTGYANTNKEENGGALINVGLTSVEVSGSWKEYKIVYNHEEDGDLTVSFTYDNLASNWIAIDEFSLVYGGEYTAYEAAMHKGNWDLAKAAAEAAINDASYANVTGQERTDLEEEIAKEEPTTAQGYDDATAALASATSAFTAAKDAYDAYAEIRDIAETLGISLDNAPANAAAAPAATHDYNVAVYNVTTDDNIFNVTEVYNPSWSDMSTSSGQHWSGNTETVYADNWRGDTNSTERSATITLPAGSYILMSAGRGSANTVPTMSANGTTVTFASNGDMGLGINKAGAASFDAEDAAGFANKNGAAENTGTGWEWRYIPVTLAEETAITVTQTLTRLSGSAWGSFSDFRILKQGVVATDADYTALNGAIEEAEARTLGFEDGQYAPYNNVAALTALAAAKAIDQTAKNEKETVEAVTTALTSAIWTANEGDVDAVYNGNFAIGQGSAAADIQQYGWTRTNSWGQFQNGAEGDNENGTAYYNQTGSLQYGNAGVYTMPLKAETVYELSFKYGAWDKNVTPTVSVLNAEDGMAAMSFAATSTSYKTSMNSVDMVFVTGAEGNYILTIAGNNNLVVTGVSITKAASQVLEFADNAEMPKYAPGTYPAVKITRTLTAGRWATAVYPFAVSGVDNIATLTGYADSKLSFTSADASEANVPFLMRSTDGVSEINLENVEVAAAAATEAVAGQAKLIGAYAATEISDVAAENKNNYVLSNNTIYRVGENSATINPYRAYIQVADAAQANALTFIVDDEVVTGIEGIATSNEQVGTLYNLNGQRVQSAKKGLYIQNGKKVVLK